ncbi:Fe-S protein assembly co-chaperone HscB [Testudinibacter sp. P80/BLE/0925]|uniref:Fe-S protein assembly co-chaperone HscB n=1 Tax=Testudinibacter sp. TW-1 TaxID=3417757 RepID=UPI003D360F8C
MQNPFELFGIAVGFQLDTALLSQRYLDLQKQYHPDNFATESAAQQLAAVQQAAQINGAYQILKNPIRRAEAILQLNWTQPLNPEETVKDNEFLLQQLLLREDLEAAACGCDEAEIAALRDKSETLRRQQLQAIENAIQHAAWAELKQQIDRLKFIEKLLLEVEQIEDRLYG